MQLRIANVQIDSTKAQEGGHFLGDATVMVSVTSDMGEIVLAVPVKNQAGLDDACREAYGKVQLWATELAAAA